MCIKLKFSSVFTPVSLRIMTILAAILILCLTVSVTLAAESTCQNRIQCTCGSTERSVTVCAETEDGEPCRKWSRCSACQDGLNSCSQCPDGLEGPFCSTEVSHKVSRQKRQSNYPTRGRRPQRPTRIVSNEYQAEPTQQDSVQANPPAQSGSSCSNPDSPKLGGIRCFTTSQQRTCVGRCLPGYRFNNRESEEEITLTCRRRVWRPLTVFPDCISGGHCDLVIQGSGSFNCTTGMTGTRCDINCNSRFAGRYYCFPGRDWDPVLPTCVTPKEIEEDKPTCRCEYGASCDSNGNCVCPVGRTGTSCEIIADEEETCPDPGFISNGFRRNTDGSVSNTAQAYEEGQSVVYGCTSEQFALQGSSLLTCQSDGTWSSSVPKCIIPTDPRQPRYCENPGSIPNGKIVYVPTLNARRPRPPFPDDEMYPQGSRLRYSCDSGYTLQGVATLTCEVSGYWSASVPTCVSVDLELNCANLEPIPNGRVRYFSSVPRSRNGPRRPLEEDLDEYPKGTRLEYSCLDGYTIQGSRTLTCQSTGFWSPDPPTCVGDCGRSFMQTTTKVLHGTKTISGEWPWVVAISVEENGSTRLICGGAVLNTRTIITAAHCLAEASTFTLRFGKLHLNIQNDDGEVLVRRSNRVVIHPDFTNSPSALDSDIGLIIFEPKIKYSIRVQPVCLPTAESTAKNLMTGRKGYVSGWGITERALQADELLVASLPVITNEACQQSYRRQNITLPISRNMFCAGYEDAKQSVCSGDSGSPLVFYDSLSKRYTVEGLVSFGVEGQCGLPGRYTIFTNVYRFLPWILNNRQ